MATFKTVSITYSDGSVINTCINPAVSDEEIKKYFAPGTPFNLGSVLDNVQRVTNVELTGVVTY